LDYKYNTCYTIFRWSLSAFFKLFTLFSGVDGITSEDAAYFSILFDVGGIVGGIIAGMATDFTGKSATTCSVMLVGAIPLVSVNFEILIFLGGPGVDFIKVGRRA
jgi:sugar phosphate permease